MDDDEARTSDLHDELSLAAACVHQLFPDVGYRMRDPSIHKHMKFLFAFVRNPIDAARMPAFPTSFNAMKVLCQMGRHELEQKSGPEVEEAVGLMIRIESFVDEIYLIAARLLRRAMRRFAGSGSITGLRVFDMYRECVTHAAGADELPEIAECAAETLRRVFWEIIASRRAKVRTASDDPPPFPVRLSDGEVLCLSALVGLILLSDPSVDALWVAIETRIVIAAARGGCTVDYEFRITDHQLRNAIQRLETLPTMELQRVLGTGLRILSALDVVWAITQLDIRFMHSDAPRNWNFTVLVAKLISLVPVELQDVPAPISVHDSKVRFSMSPTGRVDSICELMDGAIAFREASLKRYKQLGLANIMKSARHTKLLEIFLLHQRLMCVKGLCRDVVAVIVSFIFGERFPAPRRFFKKLKVPR